MEHPAVSIEAAQSIDGWMSPRELFWLAQAAKTAKVILEVGSYKGRSTRALADNTGGVIYCIDPWNGDYFSDDGSLTKIRTNVYAEFRMNLKDHVDSGKVIPIVCKFCDLDRESILAPDFIFIDADHRYLPLRDDITKSRSLLTKGGTLAGHDYDMPGWPSVKRAVDELIQDFTVVDTIWNRKY